MSILSSEYERREYFKDFIGSINLPKGSHNGEHQIRGKLGYLMKQLKESNHNDDIVEDLLKDIHKELGLKYDLEKFKKEYNFYLNLIVERQNLINLNKGYFGFLSLGSVETLNKDNWNNWGSYKQFIFGKIITDAINTEFNTNIHPIWGCLLNPTGGIVGAGNQKIYDPKWNSPLSLHSCCHDAAGYLYNYHNMGPGFNYLNTRWTLFPTWSRFSCQIYGIRWWNKIN